MINISSPDHLMTQNSADGNAQQRTLFPAAGGEVNARPVAISDYVVLTLLAALGSIACFHPYYFGDELFSLFLSNKQGAGFLDVVNGLDTYKPRVLFNALWALFAINDVPRMIPMVVNLAAMAACACLAYRIAASSLRAPRHAAFLVGLILLTSRYGTVLYFDYVSGTIETLSLLFFLLFIQFYLGIMQTERQRRPVWDCSILLAFAIITVLVHERYYAAFASISASTLLIAALHRRHADWKYLIALGVAIFLIPGVIIVVATNTLSVLPIQTGTAGLKVSLGWETIKVFATNTANVFLGLNYGFDWLVGDFNMSHLDTRKLSVLSAVLLLAAWLMPFLKRNDTHIKAVTGLWLMLPLLALIAVSSLPGAARQEGRWLFPAGTLLTFVAVAVYRGYSRLVLLLLMMGLNVAYLLWGSYKTIYNVVSSENARDLATAMNVVPLGGGRGLLLNTPGSDFNWTIGGVGFSGNSAESGDTFCRANIKERVCVDPPSAANLLKLASYNFALYYIPSQPHLRPTYRLLPISMARVVVGDTSMKATDGGRILGGGDAWNLWTWNAPPERAGSAVVLASGISGTFRVNASDIDNKVIVYHARSLSAEPSSMRLQINWNDANGMFITTHIQVVSVGATDKYFPMLVTAPKKAVTGDVYATLHDGAKGQVRLESVIMSNTGSESVL